MGFATALRKKNKNVLTITDSGQKEETFRNKVSILYKNRRKKDWKNCNFIPFYCGCVNDVYICTV